MATTTTTHSSSESETTSACDTNTTSTSKRRAVSATPAFVQTGMDNQEVEEETQQYQSLRDMAQYDSYLQDAVDDQSCCPTELEEALARELEEEATIRKSVEEEIQKYLEREGMLDEQQQQQQQQPRKPHNSLNSSSSSARKLPKTEELPDLPLEIGDHVYQWRSFAGCPGIFQHHGIVMGVGLDDNGEMELEIADFSCILRATTKEKTNTRKGNSSSTFQNERHNNHSNHSVDIITGKKGDTSVYQGILRVYKSASSDQKWHKVHYKASVWKMSLWRSGTCTCVDSDPPAKVLARAYFLLENPQVLPSYHIFESNCECVSVFCKTGKWCTLQASSLLSLTAVGQLKSTATIAAYAASQQVTIHAPAAGIWGYLGYTTAAQVSLWSTQPHLIPLLAAYGVVTVGGPTYVLFRCEKKWEATAKRLNEEFWKHAMKDPDIFAHSMMHWSEKHKAFEGS